MKRLSWVNFILVLAITLLSCQTKEYTGEKDSLYYLSLLEEKDSVENEYNYIYSLYNEKEYEKVIEQAKVCEIKYPNYTRFTKIKALSYLLLNDEENYSNSLRSILERESADETITELYLESLIRQNKKEEAASYAHSVLLLFPNNKTIISILAEGSPFYSYLEHTTQESEMSQV